MAATTDEATANDRLTAELAHQLALGHDEVTLSTLATETNIDPARVEWLMGQYERQAGSPVERVDADEVTWRLRAGE